MALQVINRNSNIFTPSVADEINRVIQQNDDLIDNFKTEDLEPKQSMTDINIVRSNGQILENQSILCGHIAQLYIVAKNATEIEISVPSDNVTMFQCLSIDGGVAQYKLESNKMKAMLAITGIVYIIGQYTV